MLIRSSRSGFVKMRRSLVIWRRLVLSERMEIPNCVCELFVSLCVLIPIESFYSWIYGVFKTSWYNKPIWYRQKNPFLVSAKHLYTLLDESVKSSNYFCARTFFEIISDLLLLRLPCHIEKLLRSWNLVIFTYQN